MNQEFYSGIGYDSHRLVEGRTLVLGGVSIPFEKGPEGHSDGDIIFHALTDALLGAAALGDIGQFFADSDERWKDAKSAIFLKHAVEELIAVGKDSVWERIASLTARFQEGLYVLGIDSVGRSKENQDHGSESGIVCFSLPSGVKNEERLMKFLESQEVFVSLRRLSGIGGIRVSPHFDNSEADVDRLLDILESFV